LAQTICARPLLVAVKTTCHALPLVWAKIVRVEALPDDVPLQKVAALAQRAIAVGAILQQGAQFVLFCRGRELTVLNQVCVWSHDPAIHD
jgi:hypothetical protein